MADDLELVAGNGLLHRRALLGGGLLSVAAAGAARAAGPEPLKGGEPPTMSAPGGPFTAYGTPSHWLDDIKRSVGASPISPGTGASRTPLQRLEGTITPSGLHFERHHNGVPDIDPTKHELLIHGLVRRPLIFSLDALYRYPMESHVRFVECGGNSGGCIRPEPQQASAGDLHGLLSNSEWTGVKLSTLLDEAGVEPGAAWVLAEGADGAGMSRSIPLAKCMDDAVIALYQNGEPIRPSQGYPMRLLLPGFSGNTNVKWLHRLKVTAQPTMTKDETSRYTALQPDGKARQFILPLEVKSVILKPSFGLSMRGPGTYEISGVAWSGRGRVRKVEVSADGGKSWAAAALEGTPGDKAVTRFRLPWRWDGSPSLLLSRATDETGGVQPTRAAWMAAYAPGQFYFYNGIHAWGVAADGKVSHAYA